MGEYGKGALRVKSDGKLMLEFHGTTISSDAGLLDYRELEEAFAGDWVNLNHSLNWNFYQVKREGCFKKVVDGRFLS